MAYTQAFLRGYCPAGFDCVNKHTFVCQPFAATGVCPNRARCRFPHPESHHSHAGAYRPCSPGTGLVYCLAKLIERCSDGAGDQGA